MRVPRSAALAALGALLLVAAAPVTGEATTGHGSATSDSVPLHVRIGDAAVDLGATSLLATTDPAAAPDGPFAAADVTLLDVAGTTVGELAVASDDTTTSDGAGVDETTPVGSAAATVGALSATADSATNSAAAALATLTASVDVLDVLDLTTTVTGVTAAVDDARATASHTLAVGGIDLDVAALLGQVAGALPLADLLALAEALDVVLPADLDAVDDVVLATEALLAAVAAVPGAATGLTNAATALDAAEALSPLAAFGDVDAVADALTSVGTLDPVSDPGSALTALSALLSTPAVVDAGCAAPLSLDLVQDVADLEACLETHLAAYDTAVTNLADELVGLEEAATALVDALDGVTDAAQALATSSTSLDDVVAAVEELLAAILGADLLDLAAVDVTQSVVAVGGDVAGSSATHACSLTAVAGLGGTPLDVVDCAPDVPVDEVLATVNATIVELLTLVGGVDVGDGVVLELFGVTDDAVDATDSGGVVASSSLEVLRLATPQVTIAPCELAGGLLCGLGVDLDALVTDALATVDGVLPSALTAADAAISSVEDVLTLLAHTGVPIDGAAATTALDDALAALGDAVDGLDLGALGAGGVLLPSLEVVVDPVLSADHVVVAAPGEPDAAPVTPTDTDGEPAPTPVTPTTDGAPTPTTTADGSPTSGSTDGAPTGSGSLPRTGGGAAALAVAAIAGGVLLRRRTTD